MHGKWAAPLALMAVTGSGLLSAPPAQAGQAAQAGHGPCPRVSVGSGWHGDNQARLQELVDRHGLCNPYRPGRAKPVAVFDWDNTVVKNDVGDATMFWLLRNGRIRQPAAGDWSTTSRFLTPAAATALADACAALARPGAPLPTGTRRAPPAPTRSTPSTAPPRPAPEPPPSPAGTAAPPSLRTPGCPS
ncbi:hypothetical protein WKI68_34990 [Streptomyces sp. MS1.HAVA.3]|uniref:Lipoprotein n=1 Tax=Streptomyces caledonius TaxID=3134107 RepID=A0ABU8UAW1_9ACTN